MNSTALPGQLEFLIFIFKGTLLAENKEEAWSVVKNLGRRPEMWLPCLCSRTLISQSVVLAPRDASNVLPGCLCGDPTEEQGGLKTLQRKDSQEEGTQHKDPSQQG